MERELILQTLEEVGGNKTRAAESLGISIRTLRNKLNEYQNKPLNELLMGSKFTHIVKSMTVFSP